MRQRTAEGPDLARPVAAEALQAYRQLATTPGADVAGVASNLIVLSAELGSAGLDSESTAAAHAAVDIMRQADLPADTLLGHRRTLAQALHVLIRRHIADGHPDLARPVATEAYQQIATTPGANIAGVASNLAVLSSELATAGLHTEAVAAAQAAADVQN